MNVMSVSSLAPDQYGIDLTVKILESVVSLALQDGPNTIHVFEHLVGDKTGCIVLKTTQDVASLHQQQKSIVHIKGGYTQVIDGFLRLVADTIESLPEADIDVNTTNNLSLTRFVRKA